MIIYLRSALVLKKFILKFYYYNLLNFSKWASHNLDCNWLLIKIKMLVIQTNLLKNSSNKIILVYLLLNLNSIRYSKIFAIFKYIIMRIV